MLAERSLPHTADCVRRETCASPSRERTQVQPWNVDVAKMKPVGEDHHQRLRRIAQAAIEHGAQPPAELLSGLRELADQISQSRSEPPDAARRALTSRWQDGNSGRCRSTVPIRYGRQS